MADDPEILKIINDALVIGGEYPQADHVVASLEAQGYKIIRTGKPNATR